MKIQLPKVSTTLLLLTFSFSTLYSTTLDIKEKVEAAGLVNLSRVSSISISTSFVSSWEDLYAVNDGYTPSSSSDKTNGIYGNWEGEDNFNTYNWVEYEWPYANQIMTVQVYWFSDGAGILQPTDAYLEYWDGFSWINFGLIGKQLNQFNAIILNVKTKKVRVNMKSPAATGIIEFRVYGYETTTCDTTELTASLKINDNSIEESNCAYSLVGNSVEFIPEIINSNDSNNLWHWVGPNGFTAETQNLKLTDLQTNQSGTYYAMYLNSCGNISTQFFHLTVSEKKNGMLFTWTQYSPTIAYNIEEEYPNLQEPTKNLQDCSGVVDSLSSGWWTFRMGANANSLVTPAAIQPMLDLLNSEFAYFRDSLGWPPDKRVKNGYRSAVYLYGSGLCTDNASNTDLGGWMGSIEYNNESWPMILLSYYPVYCFDPSCTYSDKNFQTGGVVHEGIHAVLADMPGCKNAAWFQEGGNTWLQQEAAARRSNNYSEMGFLNGAPFIAPFMPIECYSGWLQDGSFGGPSAEGVNMFDGATQICTWRTYLGGTQYGNGFAVYLAQTLGIRSIPWIWKHATSRVLEGIADSIGEEQTRRLITEYRAKQALLDMGEWTGAFKSLVNGYFNVSIGAEWQPYWIATQTWMSTPYAKVTMDSAGWYIPENRTTPGWSGANQIPFHVKGDTAIIYFQPLGDNMTCQLCYRTKTGETVYGQPVFGGNCMISLDKEPANGVVFAVVSNTNYIYKGEETRKAHYDYRLKPIRNISNRADNYLKWFNYETTITDPLGLKPISSDNQPLLRIYPNPVKKTESIRIELVQKLNQNTSLDITNSNGQIVYQQQVNDEVINVPCNFQSGLYFITLKTNCTKQTHKLIID